MAEQIANNAAGTLSGNITNVQTSFTLNAGQGAAFPSSGNFRILVGSELMLVGARSTDTLSSITRGIEGTANVAHNSGDAVTHILTQAGLLQYIQDNSVQKPASVASGEAAIWNGSAWVRSSTTGLNASGIAPGTNGQYLTTAGGVTTWSSPPVIAPTHLPGMAHANNSTTLTANTAYLVPIPNVVISTTVTRLAYGVVTQSGNMDMGIYYSDDELTFTKLFSTGSFAVPASSAAPLTKTITQQTIAPVAGRRWYYALAADNGTASFFTDNPASSRVTMIAYTKATSFPLPSSITSATGPVAGPLPVVDGLI